MEAYFKVLPKIGKKQGEVLRVFQNDPDRNFTDVELGEALGWTINRVTPRRGELFNLGYIFLDAIRVNINRNSCRAYRLESRWKA